ncbi:MarR family transcriptional regulator [uncultured Tolumonas sp.]|uniref:MarR family winged helix-turn-helix transcriptional regulator n=1 Tax=uncultured Tolumonas sp. TaxID=263765 RepID=UPI002A0A52D9|nr:MarR family transcriptional regulator [uncultured Tolumonas sp.]
MKADDSNSLLQLDKQICFALYSSYLAMSKLYRKVLKPLELTYSQYLVMLILWQEDQQSVTSIGEQLYLDSATLTPLLKRMEVAALLSRQRSAHDERHVIISLTEAGKALKEKARSVPELVLCSTSCDLDMLLDLKKQLEHLRNKILNNV